MLTNESRPGGGGSRSVGGDLDSASTVPPATYEPDALDVAQPGGLQRLLEVLGFREDERVSVCHKRPPGGAFTTEITTVRAAPSRARMWPDSNFYFSTAPLRASLKYGRGKAADVVGMRCVFADLDFGPDKAGDEVNCRAITDGISQRLGTPPVAIVHSGHGLQPYWSLKRDKTTTFAVAPDPRRDHGAAVLGRFGDLVREVAAQHDATVDSVFELARVLRIPGTTNYKDPAAPVPTSVEFPEGASALTLAQVEAACPAKLAPVAKAGAKGATTAPAQVERHASTRAYDDLDAAVQVRVDRWVDAAVTGVDADLHAARDWPAGHRDDRGRGWDKVAADGAHRYGALYRAPWNKLTEQEAHAAFLAACPTDDGFTAEDAQRKWDEQHRRADPAPWPSALDVTEASVTLLRGHPRKITAPVEPVAPDAPAPEGGVGRTGADRLDGIDVLDRVRAHFARYVSTMRESDLDLLTLWAAHTHFVLETYTTPRLVIDSPVHGSGKTTVLEHLERLCLHSVQMASLSSPALLTRMLDAGMRTMLIDEADRSLNPDNDGVAELLAVLNSGYKRGGTRPVLVATGDGGWVAREMPTYCPVAMAGNNPLLPEDTKSRTIRVLLLPDLDGTVDESDWEMIEDATNELGDLLVTWADQVRDAVRENRPPLPEGIVGRGRERWSPLKRVAHAAGGRWPSVVDELALHDKAQQEQDREDGMVRDRPAVQVLKHLHDLWPVGEPFMPTATLVSRLVTEHPDEWGLASPFGKALTVQRFGRMLATSYSLNSTRLDRTGPRGYAYAGLLPLWKRMGIVSNRSPELDGGEPVSRDREAPRSLSATPAPVPPTPPSETGASGATGSIGAEDDADAPF